MIHVIADTHWNHPNIIKYCSRPDNYRELIIENWRRLVQPADTVIHLGDVIFNRRHELRGILESLPGVKILVVGNHDKRTGTNDWFLRNGFNYVCKSHVLRDVLFTHKPVDLAEYPGIRYNVHGHLHNDREAIKGYPFYDESRHVLVSIEEFDYRPARLEELVEL